MKKLISVLIVSLMLISLVSCSGDSAAETTGTESAEVTDMTDKNISTETEASTQSETKTEIETESAKATETSTEETETSTEVNAENAFPENNSTIVIANDEVYGWWSSFHWAKTDSDPFYRHEDIYYPNSVIFSWEKNEKADYYRLFISTDEGFASECTESYLVNSNSLTLSHLFTGTQYYWYVLYTEIGEEGNEINTVAVSTRSFTTAESPRCLKIEGVSNTRDIGGLKAMDGYRIKQGMIYRGGKLEDITDAGKEFFLNYLGLKTDLDLRTPGEGGAGGKSPLGDDVNYVNLDGRYYTGDKGISNDYGKELFAQEIRLFADPDNYPIYIHCSLGRDRTGTLAMVIEGLLGVEKNDLMMDYELSVFSVTGTLDNAGVKAIRGNIQATYNFINKGYQGESFAEKTEKYLLDIGITAEEIQAIRDILLEEVK